MSLSFFHARLKCCPEIQLLVHRYRKTSISTELLEAIRQEFPGSRWFVGELKWALLNGEIVFTGDKIPDCIAEDERFLDLKKAFTMIVGVEKIEFRMLETFVRQFCRFDETSFLDDFEGYFNSDLRHQNIMKFLRSHVAEAELNNINRLGHHCIELRLPDSISVEMKKHVLKQAEQLLRSNFPASPARVKSFERSIKMWRKSCDYHNRLEICPPQSFGC